MIKNTKLSPVAAALGTTFAVTLAASPLVNSTENPFSVTSFESGYMVAGGHAEGKCGGDKHEGEGKCGEGKCGGDKAEGEGKCGEGKCGGDKAEGEGK